ncbi:MAG TPA: MBL fold metallo-hydrolase [Baekduia sp.]|nr:MBL fold metallo-hydrolase [Baekduia sp.]
MSLAEPATTARLTWLGHATVLIEVAGARLLTDPVLRGRVAHLVRRVPVPRLPDELDAVLLSHVHRDHADGPTLRRIPPGVPVIAPRGTAAILRRAGHPDVRELAVGGSVEITTDVRVRAVPARHDGRRWPVGQARSDALGFVIEGDVRVYFAGDTELFPGMTHIGDGGLDAALLPVWGWGTSAGSGHLDPDGAARAAARLRPRIAVPIHWGTYLPAGLHRTHGHLLRAPGPAFAARVSELAPAVRTVVLAPGEALELAPAVTPAPSRSAPLSTSSWSRPRTP